MHEEFPRKRRHELNLHYLVLKLSLNFLFFFYYIVTKFSPGTRSRSWPTSAPKLTNREKSPDPTELRNTSQLESWLTIN